MMPRRAPKSSARLRAISIQRGMTPDTQLLRVKSVDRVRCENADAENPNHQCCKLNHETDP
jgi:hypothetical protein